jgi:hypothetical protein
MTDVQHCTYVPSVERKHFSEPEDAGSIDVYWSKLKLSPSAQAIILSPISLTALTMKTATDSVFL